MDRCWLLSSMALRTYLAAYARVHRARKYGSKSYLGPWAFMATGPIEQVRRRCVYIRTDKRFHYSAAVCIVWKYTVQRVLGEEKRARGGVTRRWTVTKGRIVARFEVLERDERLRDLPMSRAFSGTKGTRSWPSLRFVEIFPSRGVMGQRLVEGSTRRWTIGSLRVDRITTLNRRSWILYIIYNIIYYILEYIIYWK